MTMRNGTYGTATEVMIELAPDDPAERAAYLAACESADFCHAFGLGMPDFERMVAYHTHRLEARRELDSKPTPVRPLNTPFMLLGWLALLSIVAVIAWAFLRMPTH